MGTPREQTSSKIVGFTGTTRSTGGNVQQQTTTACPSSHVGDRENAMLCHPDNGDVRMRESGTKKVHTRETARSPQHRHAYRVASSDPTAMHLPPNPHPGVFLRRLLYRYRSLVRRIGEKVISAVPHASEASIPDVSRGLTLAFRSPRLSGLAQALPAHRGAREKVPAMDCLFAVIPSSSRISLPVSRRVAPSTAFGEEFFHTAEGTPNATRDIPGICYLSGNYLR